MTAGSAHSHRLRAGATDLPRQQRRPAGQWAGGDVAAERYVFQIVGDHQSTLHAPQFLRDGALTCILLQLRC